MSGRFSRWWRGCLPALGLLLLGTTAIAADIRVLGLFDDRAMLFIDGKQRLLKVGETSPEGVKLIRSDSERAVLEIAGKREEFRLGADMHTSMATPDVLRVQIARDNHGMFRTAGAINGIPVSFMVDTGATSIAMSASMAARLGIAFRHEGKPMMVQTASGVVKAWQVMLKTVKVGEIERALVEAAVIEAETGSEILLGMSFLSTVKLEKQNNLLVLEARY
ncbi:TIGR02281 family clan AA aspartic protease [Permianibacter sp. IMCC34836]|uniref:retropepsin-like aspartic protease family protein n=1 Tax=Permianibacter fluminis TaxID=2738515 RepID=UPI00155505AC|nr:TIGR02281 family clan AA aspartic protease [Permianibacter fluminis]NQD36881.1 TIGR02281 family clan AA aspartic protease [Permianibacter fluminis]